MRAEEFLKENTDLQDAFDSYGLYRGMSIPEAKKVLQLGHLLPSSDLMPFDWEVIEYGLGDVIHDMDEDEIEAVVQDIVPWYDGSRQSVQNGVNLTSDWDNARGYAGNGVVFGVICQGDVAQFSDAHYFAQNANECVPAPVAMLDSVEITLPDLKKALGIGNVTENFKDGKKPGRKGLAKRMGVDCSQSVTKLRKIAKSSSGEKQRMAHWCANMKSGKKK